MGVGEGAHLRYCNLVVRFPTPILMLAYRFRGSLPDCDPSSAGVTLEPTGDSGVGRVLTCHNYQEWIKQIDESEKNCEREEMVC